MPPCGDRTFLPHTQAITHPADDLYGSTNILFSVISVRFRLCPRPLFVTVSWTLSVLAGIYFPHLQAAGVRVSVRNPFRF